MIRFGIRIMMGVRDGLSAKILMGLVVSSSDHKILEPSRGVIV